MTLRYDGGHIYTRQGWFSRLLERLRRGLAELDQYRESLTIGALAFTALSALILFVVFYALGHLFLDGFNG